MRTPITCLRTPIWRSCLPANELTRMFKVVGRELPQVRLVNSRDRGNWLCIMQTVPSQLTRLRQLVENYPKFD